MAQQARIQVEGLKRLQRALKKAGADDLLAMLKEANTEAALSVESAARPNVPTRTGRLVGSLRSSGTARAGVVRIGKARVPYAGPVMFGWPSRPDKGRRWRGGPIKPNPFLYDALDRRRAEVEALYLQRIERLADSIAEGT